MSGLLSVTKNAIDLNQVYQALAGDQFGAQLVFVGTVRNNNLGRSVDGVTYEAHTLLAEKIFRELEDEVRSKIDARLSVVLIHRIGRLRIGEVSTVVGVSSAHRDAAYQASRYLIEQLKLRLPVWKEEHYLDGSADWLKGVDLNHKKEFAVVVLAGGKSSRMGKDKARLTIPNLKNMDMLARAAATGRGLLREVGQSETDLYVSGGYSEYQCIRDLIIGAGPLAALYSSLVFFRRVDGNFSYRKALFIPVDMPSLGIDELSVLISQAHESDATHFVTSELPLLLKLSDKNIDVLQRRLVNGDKRIPDLSLGGFLAEIGSHKVTIVDNEAFLNLNTPAEYSHWCRKVSGGL